MVKFKSIALIFLLALSFSLFAQEETVKPAPLQGFNISGFYRFYGQHRMVPSPYIINQVGGESIALEGRGILIGDDTQLPELTLNINGQPNANTSFGTDLVVWNQNNGDFDYYRNLLLGVNLYGNFSTDYGNASVRVGGIHWHQMTSFTMKSFFGYNRFSLFERNPWDPQFKELDRRYEEYYSKGEITQDARWANQAVQGLILDLTELPLGLSGNLIYGKTQNAGSAFLDLENDSNDSTSNSFIKFYRNTIPNYVYGGQLIKQVNKHTFSLNTFNHKTYVDEMASIPIDNNIVTTEFDIRNKYINVNGEVGVAKYMDLDPGEMISLKLDFSKYLTKLPFELHYYRISPNAMNNNSEFVNTSVTDIQSASSGDAAVIGSNGVLQQNGSAMMGIGQMANNRQGLNFNTDFKIGDLKIVVGTGIAREIENINRELTFGYSVNGLTMARFWRWDFPSGVGPYGRKTVLFRSVFQSVNLTDTDASGRVINDKNFNNTELQLKYKFNLFGKQVHAFYLGAYNSAQTEFSPITVFTEDAYIRHYSHQVESYLELHKNFILTTYFGMERIIGNYQTQLNVDTKRPLNQSNIGVGIGFDYMMSKNTALYFRHRWFSFEDTSFPLDKFGGHETTLELKIYF